MAGSRIKARRRIDAGDLWRKERIQSMKKRTVLVTIPFTENQKEKLRQAAPEEKFLFVSKSEVRREELREAEVIMGNVSREQLQEALQLKWLQLNSAGANTYCEPGVLKPEVLLTNASGAYDISVSENMVAATMALFKKLYQYYDNQKKHLWRDEGSAMSPWGATVVILGLGNIGLAYARRMKAMGSYIIGTKSRIGDLPEGVDELHTLEDLPDCLRRADVVANILPETPDTIHLLGSDQFALMKPSSYVVNMGRGSAIDQDALYDALEAGKIAGAALDVTEPEPLPADHRLWDAPNLYIMPHVAGDFHIPVTLELISDYCAENLKHYISGEPLEHQVDRLKRY